MEYRQMGRAGLKLPELCLGTMTFGHGAEAGEARRMVDLCFDSGLFFFDTADAYSNGESERMLGATLKGRRSEAIIATKVFNPMGSGPNDSGMSRLHIMQAIENSLVRLQTDYVDIFYIHHVDDETPLEEMLRAFDDLVRQGKVLYVACSNYQAWRLATALGTSDAKGLARFGCYQPQYSLVVRDIEQELIPLCEYHGVGVICWAPLAGGFLSGKYKPGQTALAGTRSNENWAYPRPYFAHNADEILATLLKVAAELGRSPAQVAVRWVLEQRAITSAIVGARTTAHLRDNIGAAGWSLPPDALHRLNEVSAPEIRYPESMERSMRKRRSDAVGK